MQSRTHLRYADLSDAAYSACFFQFVYIITSSISCCPLGNFLIRLWITWNSGLGFEVPGSTTLQQKQIFKILFHKYFNKNLFWHCTIKQLVGVGECLNSYCGGSCESPLSLFMTNVPRIMARLVRPTPTWQLKTRVGGSLDALRPRHRLGLSCKAEHREERCSDSNRYIIIKVGLRRIKPKW